MLAALVPGPSCPSRQDLPFSPPTRRPTQVYKEFVEAVDAIDNGVDQYESS